MEKAELVVNCDEFFDKLLRVKLDDAILADFVEFLSKNGYFELLKGRKTNPQGIYALFIAACLDLKSVWSCITGYPIENSLVGDLEKIAYIENNFHKLALVVSGEFASALEEFGRGARR